LLVRGNLDQALSGDVIAAEDALSEAFTAALKTWPTKGAPDNAEAWLLSVARRKHIDEIRREKARTNLVNTLTEEAESFAQAISPASTFPEHRLNLMFACAHPAIDSSIRAPLILKPF